ncbi:MAG TPA: hypothetical protein VM143_12165 [Acidimicrobiales bacterium]|nr:hypothetical protein [Acidimicrobiales bacterium]
MTAPLRLLAFAMAVLAVFTAGAAVGRAVGPMGSKTMATHTRGMEHRP